MQNYSVPYYFQFKYFSIPFKDVKYYQKNWNNCMSSQTLFIIEGKKKRNRNGSVHAFGQSNGSSSVKRIPPEFGSLVTPSVRFSNIIYPVMLIGTICLN